MFFIVGHKQHAESFDGARQASRPCSSCKDARLHLEKRVVHAATAFFVPVANVRTEYVWECATCHTSAGPSDRDPLWAGSQAGTLTGTVAKAMGSAAEVATPAVAAALTSAGDAVKKADLQRKGLKAARDFWGAAYGSSDTK